MISAAFIGMFPQELVFQKNQRLQLYYVIYSKIMFFLYILHMVIHFITLYKMAISQDFRLDEISGVLCTTLLYIITFIRQLIIKYHSSLKNMINEIIGAEKIVYSLDNQEVINIYNLCMKNINRKCMLYPASIYVTTAAFMFKPLILPGYEKQIGNQTVFIKTLPLNLWFPFDKQAYYEVAYVWQIFTSLLGAAFVTSADILMVSLIFYAILQMKIMHYVLGNFKKYKQKIQAQYKIDDDTAAFVTFRSCIQHHQNIIRYVEYFNDSMNALMTFDFLQSSLQFATVFAQVLADQITPVLIACVGFYVLGMLVRLFLYYHYANEVIILSGKLAVAVWNINWYDQPHNVKCMMLVFMLRAQKSLQLQIGPFGVMSLDSLIAILKATYSYVTLMYGTK
nr:odorant receptor 12 [Pachyrhinus yasumatsui]